MYWLLVILLPTIVIADSGIISNTSGAIYFVQEVVRKICLISGIGTLLCAAMRYMGYRKNPTYIKISQPVWLFIIALALILLAYIPSPLD